MFLENVKKKFTVGGGGLERVGRVTVNTFFYLSYVYTSPICWPIRNRT